MRKISGKLLSSKPISLPLAAKRLSSFAALENGASAAVSIYLQRTADAFNNLVQFHEQNKPIKNQIKKENLIDEEKSIKIENDDVKEDKKNKRRKKKKKSDDDVVVVQVKEEELEIENVEKTIKVVKKEEISLDEEKQEKKTRRKKKRKTSDGVGVTFEVKKEVD